MKKTKLSDYATWIDLSLKPNTYVVATIKQAISTEARGSKTWIRGTPEIYSAAVDQFLRKLTIRCYGYTFWRRFKSIIPNACTLEGDGNGQGQVQESGEPSFSNGFRVGQRHMRYHLNMMFRRPAWMTLDEFKEIFIEVWSDCRWAMPDVKIEERNGDCVGYSLKEGLHTLLSSSMSF